ncbi:MAG: hypothetical protein U0232_00540 [Thermomicrobiales bacterium]
MNLGQPLRQLARNLRPPRRLSVREAWLNHEHYAGKRISLVGNVRAFDEASPAAYFTLDDGPARVGLRTDAGVLRPLIGQNVRAVGLLTFKPGVGIFLEVETIATEK